MAKITVEEVTDKKIWEDFVLIFPNANFLQSYNWGQFHQNLGKVIRRVGFYQGEKLTGVMLAIVEKAKRATYLTIPGGPLINFEDANTIETFREIIIKIGKENKCSFVRCRPQILENENNARLFEGLGFTSAPMHLHAELTSQIDLSKSEEELMSSMRKNTRYEVKQALKENITIKESQDTSDIDEFYALQIETAKRQKFVAFNKKFLKEQFEIFARENQAVLYTAYLGKKKLAQAFIIFYGNEADYHYGASTQEGRKFPGAYLIQWHAMLEAKKRGLKKYNLWGVAPEGETNHRFYGVSIFKRGFGGDDIEYLHARDLSLSKIAYRINWLIEMARKKGRRV